METDAHYYDGNSSERYHVTLHIADDQLVIKGNGIDVTWSLDEVRISAPLGAIKRSIYLPDGGKCDFENEEFAQLAEQRQGKGTFFHDVHRWESSLKLAFAALVLTIALVAGFVQFGIPVLAEKAAYAIPPSAEAALGEETLQILDKAMFEPTKIEADRRVELEELFAQVVASLDAAERNYRLELRASPKIGANAFALPGGTIIMTDELVEMAGQDEEIAAVLAHEVGHVRYRHAMRQVIQDSAVGLVVATLTGDVFSATSLVAALPMMLVDAKFSRVMERQADDVVLEYLQQQGASVDHFAAILTSMEQAYVKKKGKESGEGGAMDYFSSHPATKERIERLNQSQ